MPRKFDYLPDEVLREAAQSAPAVGSRPRDPGQVPELSLIHI